MKKKYILFILFCLGLQGVAQNEILCDLLPSVSTQSDVKFYLKEITAEEYNSNIIVNPNELVLFSNSDSIEASLQNKFPKIFKEVNNKYTFSTQDNQEIIVWNNLLHEKEYSKYSFKAQFKNYIIIFQEFYEGGISIVIDTNTGNSYLLPDGLKLVV